MFRIDEEVFIPFLVFAIPILAIMGGVINALVRQIGQQRLLEMAQRERIAAIERGIDPSKLPSLPALVKDSDFVWLAPGSARYRAQSLLIGGLVTSSVGAGLMAFLLLIRPDTDHAVWSVGIIPGFIGVAMLISSWLVWPRNDRPSPANTSGA
jgi:hypothetical protein